MICLLYVYYMFIICLLYVVIYIYVYSLVKCIYNLLSNVWKLLLIVKWINYTKKTQGEEGLKIEVLVPNPIIKSRCWQKHDITVRPMRSFCPWHFFGNMFWRINFRDKIPKHISRIKITKYQQCQIWYQNENSYHI